MDLGLSGVAVVTGASRGIGRAVVEALSAEGVSVVAGARDVSTLDRIDRVTAVSCDLAAAGGADRLVSAAIEAHGRIDYLVNNVGSGRLFLGGFTTVTDEDWERAFQTNLMSAVRMVRAAIPHLSESNGAIVNVSSLNGKIPATEAPDYSAMKAALLSLSRSLALEFAASQVRVNAVTPGPVMTDFQIGPDGIAQQLQAAGAIKSPDEYVAMVEGGVPVGRFATPNEVADLVLMLLSPRLAYVTGADYSIDGALQTG